MNYNYVIQVYSIDWIKFILQVANSFTSERLIHNIVYIS